VDAASTDAAAETLTATDVGLGSDDELPFEFTPAGEWSPLVLSFPHVGLRWPESLGPRPQVNFARNADFEVHTLYEAAAELGAARVRARFSRLVVDLNRAPDDVSPALVPDHPAPKPRSAPGSLRDTRAGARPGNRGVIWANAVGNIPILPSPLTYAQLCSRLDRYYRPYHRAVELLLERRRARFGYAILLDAHSMPSSVPGDMIVGTLAGKTCSNAVRDLALDALRIRPADPGPREAVHLDVRLDEPYQGGELIRGFGRPDQGTHALQLEVSRDLYMDEYRLELWGHTSRTAHSRRALLAATRHRVVCLLRALARAHPELR
jgi:N-formylglutamate amidohydrolase